MGIFNVRGALSAVIVCVAMGSTAASAAVVDLYRITVKGTFQSVVESPFGPPRTSGSVFSPAFGKSLELVFSMPLDSVAFEKGAFADKFNGEVTVKLGGSVLAPSTTQRIDVLSLGDFSFFDSVRIDTRLASDAFGFANFSNFLNITFTAGDREGTGVDLSAGFPRDLSPSIFEIYSFSVDAIDSVTGLNFGFASVESVSVDIISANPIAVPLPASALLLGIGLVGLGALGRRQRAG
ncbi:hypothetical protein ROLI_035930 [Roseobacter fucihabitans]|uniref:PEP-CTERM protein-sorting domain-containing protein n=1 Tax=Roseobacter fucihabitans TaxID=1537242 RepID=A0ABZ2BWR0_9RHOB|nr:VPLPA-CTERM sorting domain-containing protein [Roseobacter litoralis]MBC6964545.1 hypothetical protein [Roseobacter litoralis]